MIVLAFCFSLVYLESTLHRLSALSGSRSSGTFAWCVGLASWACLPFPRRASAGPHGTDPPLDPACPHPSAVTPGAATLALPDRVNSAKRLASLRASRLSADSGGLRGLSRLSRHPRRHAPRPDERRALPFRSTRPGARCLSCSAPIWARPRARLRALWRRSERRGRFSGAQVNGLVGSKSGGATVCALPAGKETRADQEAGHVRALAVIAAARQLCGRWPAVDRRRCPRRCFVPRCSCSRCQGERLELARFPPGSWYISRKAAPLDPVLRTLVLLGPPATRRRGSRCTRSNKERLNTRMTLSTKLASYERMPTSCNCHPRAVAPQARPVKTLEHEASPGVVCQLDGHPSIRTRDVFVPLTFILKNSPRGRVACRVLQLASLQGSRASNATARTPPRPPSHAPCPGPLGRNHDAHVAPG